LRGVNRPARRAATAGAAGSLPASSVRRLGADALHGGGHCLSYVVGVVPAVLRSALPRSSRAAVASGCEQGDKPTAAWAHSGMGAKPTNRLSMTAPFWCVVRVRRAPPEVSGPLWVRNLLPALA